MHGFPNLLDHVITFPWKIPKGNLSTKQTLRNAEQHNESKIAWKTTTTNIHKNTHTWIMSPRIGLKKAFTFKLLLLNSLLFAKHSSHSNSLFSH